MFEVEVKFVKVNFERGVFTEFTSSGEVGLKKNKFGVRETGRNLTLEKGEMVYPHV